jgi:hypothetical protein
VNIQFYIDGQWYSAFHDLKVNKHPRAGAYGELWACCVLAKSKLELELLPGRQCRLQEWTILAIPSPPASQSAGKPSFSRMRAGSCPLSLVCPSSVIWNYLFVTRFENLTFFSISDMGFMVLLVLSAGVSRPRGMWALQISLAKVAWRVLSISSLLAPYEPTEPYNVASRPLAPLALGSPIARLL